MQITIIGSGYVGLVTGTCLAELGNNVICLDIDEKKIEKLRKGEIPIYEPGLEELVIRNVKEQRLHFTTNTKEAIEKSEIIFSAVGTPPNKNHEADLKYVKQVAKEFGTHLNSYKIFVNKSTVPVGTSHLMKEIINKYNTSNQQFDVIDNPEFLREGSAIKDFMNPDRIVVGVESIKAEKIMKKLYSPLVRAGNPIIFTDIKSAEIIKYASNSFLATKISFINEIANFCEKAGADILEVAKGIGLDNRIGSKFLHAGIGYGGSCFPKDVQAFICTARKHKCKFEILQAVEKTNQNQKLIIVDKLKKKIPNLKNKKIAVWGLSFKPKTDDMREAASLVIIPKLLKEGALIKAFDPVAINNAKKIFVKEKNLQFADKPYEVLKEADALLILTEWDEFRSADLKRINNLMQGNLVIDGRNIYDPQEMIKNGFDYEGIGRSNNLNSHKCASNI
ncbi:UDP-glucose 6-dehydrogenase [Candidatus Peregrinibacteria bacterium RIFOXYC2_FULL_33_13]|nr:MAG: UDP-glucose 6-dehydrogenase [Candidatus Peregrinibacteria bacterium GW2011_GWA2_33_10]KKP41111.1 MAG: nucleotide sugar dehydrogenase, UDPglucose 6-dehydrogenase [Candidatus Peregrinibacteria bacterium GW2011_GWC2_33_13]OGJ53350.1 MAG: UDP-glucose 6-dehydrogenase [Candidatus Peregrinibacteria bacterium RIFOXYC2_FULL_33_13]